MTREHTLSSCCTTCLKRPPPRSFTDPRFALSNLLHAGPIEIGVLKGAFFDHIHAYDGWHIFSGASLHPYVVDPEDSQLCDELDYLMKHEFVAASYRSNILVDSVFIRIYIIPFDLPRLGGELLSRPDIVLKPARQYLSRLLPKIDKNQEKWDGHHAGSTSYRGVNLQPFFCPKAVLHHIYPELLRNNSPFYSLG